MGINPNPVDDVVLAKTSLGWKDSDNIHIVGTSQMNAGIAKIITSA
jgi:hypothetical protein